MEQKLVDNAHNEEAQLVLFKGKAIRQEFHNGEWYFSIIDIVEVVTGTERPRKYWNDLKVQLIEKEGFSELSAKIGQLKMVSRDGKRYETDVTNIETIFRIVQSIPSKQAEPFKRWLARLGYERLKEINDPSLAVKRAIYLYTAQGRERKWIDARIKTITSRNALTDEWKDRGIQGKQYGILTDIISKETFEKGIKEHKEFKGLKKHHKLRDHMSPLELALTMVGETATTEIVRQRDTQGYVQNDKAAHDGGKIAGDARRSIEEVTKKPVVTSDNFIDDPNQRKIIP